MANLTDGGLNIVGFAQLCLAVAKSKLQILE